MLSDQSIIERVLTVLAYYSFVTNTFLLFLIKSMLPSVFIQMSEIHPFCAVQQ